MKPKELRRKSKKALRKNLNDLRGKLRDFRFRLSSNKLKNTKEIRETKKNIARILTILKEKVSKS